MLTWLSRAKWAHSPDNWTDHPLKSCPVHSLHKEIFWRQYTNGELINDWNNYLLTRGGGGGAKHLWTELKTVKYILAKRRENLFERSSASGRWKGRRECTAAAKKRITTDTDETQKTAAICIMRLFIGPQLSQARDSWPKSVVVLFPRLHSRRLHLKKEKETGCGWQEMGKDAIGAISRRAV